MDCSNEPEFRIGFFSFVGSTYSRSSTLLNFNSPGIEKEYIHVPAKFFKSAKWIFINRRNFTELDVLVVMSPCHVLTPMLKMATKKLLILDAGWSLTDGVLSRGFKVRNFYKLPLIAAIDLISMHSASFVLVESMLQRNRVRKFFALPLKKLQVSYTGLDETQFKEDHIFPQKELDAISKLKEDIQERRNSLTVLFRGKVNNESGFENICDAARILSNKVTFIFILAERDVLPNDLKNVIKLSNVSSIEMRKIYEMAHVAVGQISVHSRLKYTIPHKAFEAGCFRKAYVTSGSDGIREIFGDESVLYLSETSPESLAAAILSLTNDEIRNSLEIKIGLQYQLSLSQEVINKEFARLIRTYTN